MEEPVRVSPGDNGELMVALFGDIDYANAPVVMRDIRTSVTQTRPPALHIDIAGVTFLDSSGLGVLVGAYRAATEIGATFQVLGPRRVVYDQLQLAGLVELFAIDAPPTPAR